MTWIWQHHPEAGRAGALVLSRRVVQFEIQKEGIKEEAVAGTFVYFLPAVMTDPFVQRMMARSHARRAAVAQTLGNKENVSMSDSTRSRLKHLSALHSGNSSEALSPLQPSVDNIEPPRTASLPKKSDFSPDRKLRKEPGDMEMHQPVKIGENQGPTSPHKPRLTSLAKRCQEINNWDDDYSYHSSSHGSQEAQGFTPTDSRSKLYYDFKKDQQKNANEESPSKTFSTTRIPSPPASPSKVRSISLAELIRSNSPQKSSQVTKQESSTACLPVTQTSNTCLPLPPPPPVVVSCLPKSPVSSPSRLFARVSSPETKIKGRGRDVSPSKVGEMRSRWEQHIRQASPERTDRSRSPRKTESPKKVPSPKKNQQVTSTSNTEIPSQSASVNHESPSKSPEK
ncbi:hypothetical protein E2C01_037271 [Portunus trituberculatus]|uniref:Uncharacterized protein n=2 Tax=Portunus trituberculatus TaxID=210409 RepID=A0A5B7F8X8_PORTR|nr:hypothetical protein [Portunus trituberculatus]